MKRVWSGLLIGIGTLPAMAAACEHSSLQGDVQGSLMPAAKSVFTSAAGRELRFRHAERRNGCSPAGWENRRIRTLVENGPADGEHTLLFALPVKQHTSLVLHGEAGKPWRFQWRMKETSALPRVQMLAPESPTLQALAKEIAAVGVPTRSGRRRVGRERRWWSRLMRATSA
jgi:enterochelin esterase family protein